MVEFEDRGSWTSYPGIIEIEQEVKDLSDCDICSPRNFCGCPNAEWFPISALNTLCRVQCIFLIEHLNLLEDGKYPGNPKPTGYTGIDPAIRVVSRITPRWMTVAELYAEISGRLKTTGDAGEALIDEIQNWHENLPVTVGDYRIEYWQLSRPAQKAVNYISGAKRRRQTFSQWKAEKNRSKIVVIRR